MKAWVGPAAGAGGLNKAHTKYVLIMIDASAEEYRSKIENQSDRASVGTKLVQPFESTMTVY